MCGMLKKPSLLNGHKYGVLTYKEKDNSNKKKRKRPFARALRCDTVNMQYYQ